ncbi:MAG: hypothetical protein KGI80_04060 [Verrucomicrobiota bacterium]|nr:hypothetical protein [Verrucomicrobiota bacterium]
MIINITSRESATPSTPMFSSPDPRLQLAAILKREVLIIDNRDSRAIILNALARNTFCQSQNSSVLSSLEKFSSANRDEVIEKIQTLIVNLEKSASLAIGPSPEGKKYLFYSLSYIRSNSIASEEESLRNPSPASISALKSGDGAMERKPSISRESRETPSQSQV